MVAPHDDERTTRAHHSNDAADTGAPAWLKRLARRRSAMRAVIAVERVWPHFLPIVCLAALFIALSWFGFFHAVPDWLRIATLAIFAGGLVVALFGLRAIHWPNAASVERRLEETNGITHQALAVQDDTLENDSDFSRALWSEHRRRMAARIAELRVGIPNPDTPRRDPYALRALVAFVFVTAFAYSFSGQGGFVSDAFVPSAGGSAAAPVRVDAWVTPPAYTGRAPVFLTRAQTALPERLSVPEGSQVTVRVSGHGDPATVSFRPADADDAVAVKPQAVGTESARAANRDGEQETQRSGKSIAQTFEFKAKRSGTVSVDGAGVAMGWQFDVIADNAPEIAFDGEPEQAANGALELAYSVKDDYGAQEARAEIVPADRPAGDAHPLYGAPDYPLTLPARGGIGKARSSRDLTDHPLAGQRVKITLTAKDAAGQEGRSETRTIVLPEHFFADPLARAVVEQRRTFALDTNLMPRALDLADALTIAPEETFDNPTHYLLLRSARQRMAMARDDAMMRDAADYLWDIALGIENGDLSLAQQRLRDAQRALSEALKNDASDEEIAQLMKDLREAMNDFMREMARSMQQNPQQAEKMPNSMDNVLRKQDLDRMMDQIENLARSGEREQAEQLLSELQRMMNNLQAGRRQQPNQGNGRMRQQMDKLGELMREQQALMDQTYQMNRQLHERMRSGEQQQGRQKQQGQKGQEGRQGEQGQQMTAQQLRQALKELRRQQQALKDQLGDVQKQLGQMGMKPGKGLGEAERQMGDAAGSLGKGQGGQAVDQQGRALQALRQGAQSMMDQMRQAGQRNGRGRGRGRGQQRGEQVGENDRDPLGRPRSSSGPDFGDRVKVPDEIDIQRAREILDQIRDRLGNALSPQMEKRYLERLLDLN